MSKLKMAGIFVSGLCLGGVITGLVVKSKYEEILEKEIQSVKDTYKNREGITNDFIARKEYRDSDLMENCEVEQVATTDDIKEYNKNKDNRVKTDYTKYGKKTTEITIEETTVEEGFKEYSDVDKPVLIEGTYIPPTLIDEEEVGMHGFDMQVLTYYSDGVLVDECDEVIDIETYIGLDNVKLFDETDCSSIFVRNEHMYLDYEVQRDDMTWGDFSEQFSVK